MGIVLPIVIFFLLRLTTISQLLTIAASTFLTWGVTDFFSSILERPRLTGRSPGKAIRQDWDRRQGEE